MAALSPTSASVPDPSRGPSALSEVAEEFRRLESARRHGGLPQPDAERYYSLFARLSELLAQGERNRKADQRQFLRVPAELQIVVRDAERQHHVACRDFGGGGCFFQGDLRFQIGDTVWLDGAILGGKHYPLHGRATVVWMQLSEAAPTGYGARFVLECDTFRDEIDRLFYRVLDLVLHQGDVPEGRVDETPRRRAPTVEEQPEISP